MTLLQEFIQKSSQLPKEIFDKHFKEPLDYTKYPCIHHDEYDYYPDLDGIVRHDIPLTWETGKSDLQTINIHNPEHIAEFKRRLDKIHEYHKNIAKTSYCIIYWNSKYDMYSVDIYDWVTDKKYIDHINTMRKKRNMQETNIFNIKAYYEHPRISFDDKPWLPLLLECIVLAHLTSPYYIIPRKHETPDEWEGGLLNV